MQHLEVSCAVRPIQWPLGVKWLTQYHQCVHGTTVQNLLLTSHFYTNISHNFTPENFVYLSLYREGNTVTVSQQHIQTAPVAFLVLILVLSTSLRMGDGLQDGVVGDRLAYPRLPASIQTWLCCCFLSPFLASHHQIFSTKSQNRLLCCIRNPLPAS